MPTPIALKDLTIHPVVEQQGSFFDALGFFPALTKELLDENRSWLQPHYVDEADKLVLCIQSFVIKTPHHNILVDSCVGNHKPSAWRPRRLEHAAQQRPLGADLSQGALHNGGARVRALDAA